eukprot:superscaffoldBa00000024_g462
MEAMHDGSNQSPDTTGPRGFEKEHKILEQPVMELKSFPLFFFAISRSSHSVPVAVAMCSRASSAVSCLLVLSLGTSSTNENSVTFKLGFMGQVPYLITRAGIMLPPLHHRMWICSTTHRSSVPLFSLGVALPCSLLDTGYKTIISGPIPTHNRETERWSRLFALPTLLKDNCAATGIPYINDFDLFWVRPILRGSQMLYENMDSSLRE